MIGLVALAFFWKDAPNPEDQNRTDYAERPA
jgi:hypothetical protein